jgi:glycerol-3-phosphate dehydrogenase
LAATLAKTRNLSRDHLIDVSDSGLITITGGKWTTYRKMAEDVINIAIEKNGLPENPCVTQELKLYGHDKPASPVETISLTKDQLTAAIKKSVEEEMCMTVEDFLSRRTRQLLLDAPAAMDIAPFVAKMMAQEMGKDDNWIKEQINIFNEVAKHYAPTSNFKHQTSN